MNITVIGSAIILLLVLAAEVCSKKNGNGNSLKAINTKIDEYNNVQKAVLDRLDLLKSNIDIANKGQSRV